MQRILEDKSSQLAIGIFVGTFAHSGIALREVQTGEDGVVPGVAVVVAFVLVIASIDIAERSVSESSFLDPTTAVQAIDRLYDCLGQLAPRPFPDGQYHDDTGKVRLVTRTMLESGARSELDDAAGLQRGDSRGIG